MRYFVITALCLLCMLVNYEMVSAQDTGATVSQKTGVTANSRFEIIQTISTIKTTLKLDKFTGDVYEFARNKTLVRNKDEEYAWGITKRLPHSLDKNESLDRVNYQIVTIETGVKYTFLMNVDTGASWILSINPNKDESEYYWYPVKTQKEPERIP